MHNGYFTSLEDVVHFYNTRDVAANLNKTELGSPALARRTDDPSIRGEENER